MDKYRALGTLFAVSILISSSSIVFAEEGKDNVLEVMCKQVLSSQLDLSPKVLLEKAKDKIVAIPSEILAKAIDTLSEAPEALAEKIESLKTPTGKSSTIQALAKKVTPSGNSTSLGNEQSDNSSLLASVTNAGLDFASILVKNWYWTLAGLALIYLFFKFY